MGMILGGRRVVFLEINISEKKLAIKWKNIFLPDRTPKIYSPLFNCYYRIIMPTAQIVNPLGFDRHQCLLI